MKLGKDVGIDRCAHVDTVVHSKFKAGSRWDKEVESDMQSELSWWAFDSTQFVGWSWRHGRNCISSWQKQSYCGLLSWSINNDVIS